MKRKYAAIAVLFGSCADRYVLQGYTPQRSFDQMLEDARQVPGITGIEVIGGWHINDENMHARVKQIADAGFQLAGVIPEIWANPKWGWGTFASTDPGIRREAIERIKVAMDLAASTGCNHVSPWFGHDGWDYIFQMDYLKAYDWIIEGLIECAGHNPQVKISVEFKPKEPRTHILVGNTAKTLLLINEVNRPNVGINLDTGHAIMGYESLAEFVSLMKRFGNRLFHLHLNDNYRLWDDDMILGSVHTHAGVDRVFLVARPHRLRRLVFTRRFRLPGKGQDRRGARIPRLAGGALSGRRTPALGRIGSRLPERRRHGRATHPAPGIAGLTNDFTCLPP